MPTNDLQKLFLEWSLNWISSVAGRVVLAEPGHGAKDIDR
ncbi:MAG: hypothetical protein RL077_5222 [Verrucomicrobiota bacterium]